MSFMLGSLQARQAFIFPRNKTWPKSRDTVQRRDCVLCSEERLCPVFSGDIVSCIQRRDCVLSSEERLCLVFRKEILSCVQKRDCALLRAKTSALLRRKTCAVLRARTCALLKANTKEAAFSRLHKGWGRGGLRPPPHPPSTTPLLFPLCWL